MRPTFDMDALRTMVVGIEMGSFARAASYLGRSQSAVSMQLKKLEEQANQPLFRRQGRGLVTTEAGEALLTYARRIIALNDEAALSLGATTGEAAVRMGIPQDFFDDLMPEAFLRFSRHMPGVHLEVRAGRNHALEEEVRAGRIDVAFAYFPQGSDTHGIHVASLPMKWFGGEKLARPRDGEPIPLVVFDHPCLFRQLTLRTLEIRRLRWRLALTTPSLPGIWAAVRASHGITARASHRVPDGMRDVGSAFNLPKLPSIELRMLEASQLSPAAIALRDILFELVSSRHAPMQRQRAFA
ncbi:LysR substrate-binding domain-containing protein [Rhodoligotrophos defluvii]|uniref:LysR substrate-binding domain-containing protein n=1 Tax=Rhodoligotrophos defluvii TaxID=2561934 RepID=UPI0010C95C2A|nr:LysR substrate-binding domain-containing protein [Rhodoligotrophos defluvii]